VAPARAHHRAPLVSRSSQASKQAKSSRSSSKLLAEVPFGPTLRMRRHQLRNGLRVLVIADPSAPVISYQTWFRVGSRHERPGKTGLAHLFEHLMFNETENLAAGQFDRQIEAAGGETNASTWVDWTHYHAELPASELATIVRLEADRMANLVLRTPQLVSEKEVVQNERRYRVEDDIEGIAAEVLFATAFRKHPYRWPTIGWMRDIRGYTLDDCRNFYRTWYAPNNATLVVAGDVDERKLLALVEAHYGGMRAARIPPTKAVREPVQRAERRRVLRRPAASPKMALGYHGPAFGHPDHVALSALNDLLCTGRSSRLFRRLVEDEDLAAEVHGDVTPFRDAGLYELWIELRAGKRLEHAQAIIDSEIERLQCELPREHDLDRVKHRIELASLLALESANGKAEQAGFYETVLDDASLAFDRLDAYRALRPEDIQRVAREYLRVHNRTRIDVVPQQDAA
jgi:zinc protease